MPLQEERHKANILLTSVWTAFEEHNPTAETGSCFQLAGFNFNFNKTIASKAPKSGV